jgi:hypothetical protein
MYGAAWAELFRLIPERRHDQLSLMTCMSEIAIQQVIRLADDYLILRGRLAGTSDANRLFVVPFDQIIYMVSQNPLRDEEVAVILGLAPLPPLQEELKAAEPEVAPEPEPEPEPEPAPPPVSESDPDQKHTPTAFPNRQQLLDRIRSRARPGANRPKPADG